MMKIIDLFGFALGFSAGVMMGKGEERKGRTPENSQCLIEVFQTPEECLRALEEILI